MYKYFTSVSICLWLLTHCSLFMSFEGQGSDEDLTLPIKCIHTCTYVSKMKASLWYNHHQLSLDSVVGNTLFLNDQSTTCVTCNITTYRFISFISRWLVRSGNNVPIVVRIWRPRFQDPRFQDPTPVPFKGHPLFKRDNISLVISINEITTSFL